MLSVSKPFNSFLASYSNFGLFTGTYTEQKWAALLVITFCLRIMTGIPGQPNQKTYLIMQAAFQLSTRDAVYKTINHQRTRKILAERA